MNQEDRIALLSPPGKAGETPPGPVRYWMQASVRTRYNHALEYAVHLANHRRVPLEVFFALTPDYPMASRRHYQFLLEGLADVQTNLAARGIPFVLYRESPPGAAVRLARESSTIVTDRGYTRIQRQWREEVARSSPCPVVQVETNLVVPVETASSKEEYSAATFRPRITRQRDTFLQPLSPLPYWNNQGPLKPGPPLPQADLFPGDPLEEPFPGGEDRAARELSHFLEERLSRYDELRNVPDRDWTSRMSAYLHFGQISPLEIALKAIDYHEAVLEPGDASGIGTLLEELIVRRELAANYTFYNPRYDSYQGLPQWARATLEEHRGDPRPWTYSLEQLQGAETHDPYWNAAQMQMIRSGRMHGYMRMYWGKKILEWTPDPEEAFNRALILNDTYQLDGRDPNGYAGVAWCFGKHDRPWKERAIFGKIRYMNDRGLERKFREISRYTRRWAP